MNTKLEVAARQALEVLKDNREDVARCESGRYMSEHYDKAIADLEEVMAQQQAAEPITCKAATEKALIAAAPLLYQSGHKSESLACNTALLMLLAEQQAAEPDWKSEATALRANEQNLIAKMEQQHAAEPVTDEENEQFSEDVSNFKGADPEATKFALEQFLKRRDTHPAPIPQAVEPSSVLVDGFGRVAMRKLNDLCEKGYAINGVSIATINEAGETELGAVTTGGRVLWWPQQPAHQAAEPVALGPLARRRVFDYIRGAYDLGYNDARNAKAVPGDGAPGYKGRNVEADHGGALLNALKAQVTQQAAEPLTDARIDDIADCHRQNYGQLCDADDLRMFARAIEGAHGITGSKTGGAA